jgi:hypothetical protein
MLFKINRVIESVLNNRSLDNIYTDYYIAIDFYDIEFPLVCVTIRDDKITEIILLDSGICSNDYALDISEEYEIKWFMEKYLNKKLSFDLQE